MANVIKLEKDKVLIHENEFSSHMYWLQSGQLVVTKKRHNEEVILGHISSGELVGEMSFLDGEPRSATVKALVDCELVEIPQEVFDKVFKSQPPWFQGLVKTLTERLRKANNKMRV